METGRATSRGDCTLPGAVLTLSDGRAGDVRGDLRSGGRLSLPHGYGHRPGVS